MDDTPKLAPADCKRAETELLSYLESPKFVKASTNASRLVSRLKNDVQSRQLYQAHQDLRNIYFRFSSNKEKIAALNNLLYFGAVYLLDSNELITGQDISLLLLEVSSRLLQNRFNDENKETAQSELANSSIDFHHDRCTLSLEICQQVTSIAMKLPDNDLGQPRFIAEVLKILNPNILNRDLLHNVLATTFWHHGEYMNARYHFLHCVTLNNASDVAKMLIEFHTARGYKKEVDLFITQFIFQLLCLQNPLDPPKRQLKQDTATSLNNSPSRKSRHSIRNIAEKVFLTYTLKHPQLNQVDLPFTSLPLLNFTYFIISTLDLSQSESNAFRLLQDIYKQVWSRDPNFHSYLNRIGIVYFGLVDSQKQQQGGFLNNILMSLFEDADESDYHNEGDDDVESDPSNRMSLCDELD